MFEKKKYAEARFFYDHMGKAQGDKTCFEYYLSAFLAATRSVMQYAYEEAKRNGYQNTWFQDYMDNSEIFRFFRDERDMQIHERPAGLTKSVSVTVGSASMYITLPALENREQTAKFFMETMYKCLSGIDVLPDELEKAKKLLGESKLNDGDSVDGSVKYLYEFILLPDNLRNPKKSAYDYKPLCIRYDVMELCELYLAEQEVFIVDGIRRGIIAG